MKKYCLLIFSILLALRTNAQDWKGFLEKDLITLLDERADSLESILTDAYLEKETADAVACQTIHFLYFLQQLQSNPGLSSPHIVPYQDFFAADTIDRKSIPPDSILCIVTGEPILELLNKSFEQGMGQYRFLAMFPGLKKKYESGRLLFYGMPNTGASAPAITFPPLPELNSTTILNASEKRKVADVWLQHIKIICGRCNYPEDELKKYYALEKQKAGINDYDKLIEIRQKFALFVHKNYAAK